jgi:hypothetical protein
LREGCSLAVEAVDASRQLRLTIRGRTGALFLLERSDDLRVWTPVVGVTPATEPILITDPLGRDGRCRFYRARPAH